MNPLWLLCWEFFMFNQKLKQCNYLKCLAVKSQDQWGSLQLWMAYLLIVISHAENISLSHCGIWRYYLLFTADYVGTFELFVRMKGDVLTSWEWPGFICKLSPLFESQSLLLTEITKCFFRSASSSVIAAASASLGLCSLLAIGSLIEALLSHVYRRGNIAPQIIIVLWINITTERRLCFNASNTGPSSFVTASLPGLS